MQAGMEGMHRAVLIEHSPPCPVNLPLSQCPCHWFPVEPPLHALQTGNAGGSWASTRATSSPPTTRGITLPTSSVPGTSTRRQSARSSLWCLRSSSPLRTSAAMSWSCGKTVGNRACCGAHGRSRGRKRLGFGRAALCKGRKLRPRVAGGDFWELGERGDWHRPAALVSCWIRGMCMG